MERDTRNYILQQRQKNLIIEIAEAKQEIRELENDGSQASDSDR